MECTDYDVVYPDACESLDQDEEWILLCTDENREKIRLHDYERFFSVPGLYETVMYNHLKCVSPAVVCGMLQNALRTSEEPVSPRRVLDFGAGNGMVAECLKQLVPCRALVGLDIIEEAKTAAERDRPGVYDDYLVADLAEPLPTVVETLRLWDFDTLMTVAALGFGDIPAKAFRNAFDLVRPGAWVAFNIKEDFLAEGDDSGFFRLIREMMGDRLEVFDRMRYRHRLSLAGDPLHYHGIVGRKTAA